MNPPYGVLQKAELVAWVVLILLSKTYCTLLKISDNGSVKDGKFDLMTGVFILCFNCHKDF